MSNLSRIVVTFFILAFTLAILGDVIRHPKGTGVLVTGVNDLVTTGLAGATGGGSTRARRRRR